MKFLALEGPDADVDDADAVVVISRLVVGGHLYSSPLGLPTIGIDGLEGVHVHLVVGKENVALEVLGLGAGVVLQTLDREVDSFWAEEKQLFAGDIEIAFVDFLEQGRGVELDAGSGRFDLDLGPLTNQFEQFAPQVPTIGGGASDFAGDHRIVLRPVAFDGDLRVAFDLVDLLHAVAGVVDAIAEMGIALTGLDFEQFGHTGKLLYDLAQHSR